MHGLLEVFFQYFNFEVSYKFVKYYCRKILIISFKMKILNTISNKLQKVLFPLSLTIGRFSPILKLTMLNNNLNLNCLCYTFKVKTNYAGRIRHPFNSL